MSPARTQLRMERPNLDDLPPVRVPPPYTIRTYQPNDEAPWTELVVVAMSSQWTVEDCRRDLIGAPGFDPDGLFFAAKGDEVVGTACAFYEENLPPDRGTVHMVCVHPDHRGHGLGYWLTLATLHRFRERGFRSVHLRTDDERLPAIHTYLKLGFQPVMIDESYPARWEALMAILRGGSA